MGRIFKSLSENNVYIKKLINSNITQTVQQLLIAISHHREVEDLI
jgi:hypothetical protein